MDALSDIRYGKEGLTDIPIPLVSAAQAYIDAKIPHWVYYCCAPTGPVAQPLHGHAADEGPHVGLAVLPPRGRGLPALGLQLLAQDGAEEIGDPFHDASNGAAGRASPTATRS